MDKVDKADKVDKVDMVVEGDHGGHVWTRPAKRGQSDTGMYREIWRDSREMAGFGRDGGIREIWRDSGDMAGFARYGGIRERWRDSGDMAEFARYGGIRERWRDSREMAGFTPSSDADDGTRPKAMPWSAGEFMPLPPLPPLLLLFRPTCSGNGTDTAAAALAARYGRGGAREKGCNGRPS